MNYILQPRIQDHSTRDDQEAKSDLWTITGEFIYRQRVEPKVILYVPKEETFPIPMKYTDVTRTSIFITRSVVGNTG